MDRKPRPGPTHPLPLGLDGFGCLELLDHYGLEAIEASERDILHGAALAAAELPEPEEGAAPPGAYTCC